KAKDDQAFQEEIAYFQRDTVGRPSPLNLAEGLTEHCDGAKNYLKREELTPNGAHKINNGSRQIHLARRRGRTPDIAQTGT
ncbi:tryptophan synthase subunit beta, partial [Pseudomonas aeruginosa]